MFKCFQSLHNELSQSQDWPSQPEAHGSSKSWQQINLLDNVVLLKTLLLLWIAIVPLLLQFHIWDFFQTAMPQPPAPPDIHGD